MKPMPVEASAGLGPEMRPPGQIEGPPTSPMTTGREPCGLVRRLRIVPRTHVPGRLWVAVRSNYVEPPFGGLDEWPEERGRKPAGSGGPDGPHPAPEATVPKPKIAASGAPPGERVFARRALRFAA